MPNTGPSLHRLLRFFLGSCGLLPALLPAAPDSIEAVEQAAAQWIKIRAETVRLENDWVTQRQILESTVNALDERARALEEKRDNLKAKTARERSETEAMQAKNQAVTDSMQAVDRRLQTLHEKLVRLRPFLPPRLSDALELPYRSLAAADLAPGERMQRTMTVLNRCIQFNRAISCDEEVLTLPGEPAARSLEVIYWGLSHGYALDRAAGKARIGAPGPAGWCWQPCPEAVRSVIELIAVYKDKAEPEFHPVPARLAHAAPETSYP
jgi:hypothetical protein